MANLSPEDKRDLANMPWWMIPCVLPVVFGFFWLLVEIDEFFMGY